jgi:hypothetical protein
MTQFLLVLTDRNAQIQFKDGELSSIQPNENNGFVLASEATS